ncbi:MAG TPA: class I SAM-dependent methyltransferase [Lacipirellulaceae bacterium]|nr:class I SAM-dependent methyltransferase [Lacipirellulaceae bacterium]
MKLNYAPQYYDRLKDGARHSAEAVVPVVIELIRPKSVIDLGCGIGAWLAEFKRRGVPDTLGVDGPHISTAQLEIDPRDFLVADLAQPLRLHSYFDLAVSLEVAEHLDPVQADQFVETLTRLAPVVLFSAAIPYQGGEHHINEQWPAYWAKRFEAQNFAALDPFRRLLWERPDVDWWYAQNLVLFVRRDRVAQFPWITASVERGIPTYVHPQNYLNHTWQNRVLRAAIDIATSTHPGDTIIVADEDRFGSLYLPGRYVRPFIERNGAYNGPPRDDAEALSELTRMKAQGASYFVVGWPVFWWLQFYKRFGKYLQQHHSNVLNNENVIMYRLEP